MHNFKQSLKIKRKLFPRGNVTVLISFFNLMDIYVKLNELDEVEKLWDSAVECIENLGDAGNKSLVGSIYTAYGQCLMKRDRYTEACQVLDKGYQIREKHFTDKPFLFHNIHSYVIALRHTKQYRKATEVGRKGEKAVPEVIKQRPEHTLIQELYFEIYQVYKEMKDTSNIKKYSCKYIEEVDRLMHTDLRHEKEIVEQPCLNKLNNFLESLDNDLKSTIISTANYTECSVCNFHLKNHLERLQL